MAAHMMCSAVPCYQRIWEQVDCTRVGDFRDATAVQELVDSLLDQKAHLHPSLCFLLLTSPHNKALTRHYTLIGLSLRGQRTCENVHPSSPLCGKPQLASQTLNTLHPTTRNCTSRRRLHARWREMQRQRRKRSSFWCALCGGQANCMCKCS